MKIHRIKECCGFAVATLLLGGASLASAQTTNINLQDFTADASGTGIEWGPAGTSVAWDGGVGNPAGFSC